MIANVEKVFDYFPSLTSHQKKQFSQLEKLYTLWNNQINVISRKDINQLYTRHVIHSLGIAKIVAFKPESKILDVGTGGGFPGIPLAIIFPETDFVLIDSIGKKIKVVNEVADALGLKNVKAIHGRAEDVDEKFDFVVSRAVTRMKPFYQWVKRKFKKESVHQLNNGILYLKGGDLDEELKESKLRYKIFALKDHLDEEFFESKKVVYVEKQ